MKKIIAAVLVIAIIAAGGFLVYNKVIMSPKRQIVGTWENAEIPNLGYTFNKDGTMTGTVNLPLFGEVTINGTYTMDEKAGTIDIVYTYLSISYTDKRNFVLEGDNLTLSDTDTNYVGKFVRAGAQATSAAE